MYEYKRVIYFFFEFSVVLAELNPLHIILLGPRSVVLNRSLSSYSHTFTWYTLEKIQGLCFSSDTHINIWFIYIYILMRGFVADDTVIYTIIHTAHTGYLYSLLSILGKLRLEFIPVVDISKVLLLPCSLYSEIFFILKTISFPSIITITTHRIFYIFLNPNIKDVIVFFS